MQGEVDGDYRGTVHAWMGPTATALPDSLSDEQYPPALRCSCAVSYQGDTAANQWRGMQLGMQPGMQPGIHKKTLENSTVQEKTPKPSASESATHMHRYRLSA